MYKTQPSKHANNGRKRIFVIDDDKAILEVVSMILEDVGYEVETMEDGSLLKYINVYPDLFLLDIRLSGWDGRDIGKFLKSNRTTKNIPIIIFSAHRNIRKITTDIGADDFIEKPFEIDQLLSKVKKHIKN